jgi:hypothetical protein
VYQNPPSHLGIKTEISRLWSIPVESLKVEREERSKATPPFGFAQDRELVERLVEWQMMP